MSLMRYFSKHIPVVVAVAVRPAAEQAVQEYSADCLGMEPPSFADPGLDLAAGWGSGSSAGLQNRAHLLNKHRRRAIEHTARPHQACTNN